MSDRSEDRLRLDPSRVPAQLRPGVPLVSRWGGARSEEDVMALAERLTDDQKAGIQELAKWFTPQRQRVFERWADEKAPIGESAESSAFYFSLKLLDALGILQSDFEDTLEYWLKELHQVAWRDRSSQRAWAAFSLGDFSADAERLVPELEAVLSDRDQRVQAAARYSLVRLRPESRDQHIRWLVDHQAHRNEDVETWILQCLEKLELLGLYHG